VVRPLRHAVLREGMDFATTALPGDDDPRAAHFAVRDGDGEVIAVGTIVPEEPGFRVRGMATAPSARGRGLGTVVLAALLAHADAEGAEPVWCTARPRALSLYERAGFEPEGEPFDVPALGPHQRMVRHSTATTLPVPA
jgi:GNAT superfamily N-acetyltransferase